MADIPEMSPDEMVAAAGRHAAEYLDRIARLFKPGKKLTLLVRSPGLPDRDFMLTDDNIDEAIAMLERSKQRKDVKL